VTELHVLRVFLGPSGSGGNPLGVFAEPGAVPPERRPAVAAELGFSETVFVDAVDGGTARIAIWTPAVEMRFAGHPTIGASWLLRELGRPVGRLAVPAGEVVTWREGRLTWVRARPEWIHEIRFVEFATPGEVEDLRPPRPGDPAYYAWAWEDAGVGILRARYFATDIGIPEDEATGAAAVALGGRMGRELTIHQGVGSVLHVRPGPGATVEVGGRVALQAVRRYG
jgi:predicted PhzF superfamily epimerase YddE/YHI9